MNRRTWGPFNGAQLTVILVALIAATIPGTLWAIDAYTNVAIQDPLNGQKTMVDNRRLITYDPINGASEYPANFVRFHNSSQISNCSKVATPPAGKALVIQTLLLDTWQATTVGTGYSIYFYVGVTPCGGTPVLGFNPSGIGLVTANLEPGVNVPAGQSLWRSKGNPDISVDISGTGYLVPAPWVPASPPSVQPTGAVSEASPNLQVR